MKNIIFTILLLLLPMPDLLYPQDVGEMLFNTTYDYLYNNSPSTFIEMVDLDNDGNPDPVILLADKLYYKINNVWNSLEPFPQFYRPISMQYCSEGPFSGKILALANNSVNGSMFALIDPGKWQISNINLSDLFRSFVYLNDGNILVQKSNSTTFDIYKSTDQGATFNYLVTVGDGDPSVDLLTVKMDLQNLQ